MQIRSGQNYDLTVSPELVAKCEASTTRRRYLLRHDAIIGELAARSSTANMMRPKADSSSSHHDAGGRFVDRQPRYG
jgi:hypothetical protein